MCYSGCIYENRNGGCNKGINKMCPQRLKSCNSKSITRCRYNQDGYCTSTEECEHQQED